MGVPARAAGCIQGLFRTPNTKTTLKMSGLRDHWAYYSYPPQTDTYTDLVRDLRARSLSPFREDQIHPEDRYERARSVPRARSASPFCDRPTTWSKIGPDYTDLQMRVDDYLERVRRRDADRRFHLTWSKYNSPLCYGWPYNYHNSFWSNYYTNSYQPFAYSSNYNSLTNNKLYKSGYTYYY